MGTSAARVARWVDVISELLQQPLTRFPHATICAEIGSSFDVVTTAWSWRDADGGLGFELHPALPGDWPDSELGNRWRAGDLLDRHPLLRWFEVTGDSAPQSTSRVPTQIATLRDQRLMADVLRPVSCELQLSIPYVLRGIEHRAFVLARTGRDFDDDDLEVAQRLQPALCALERQSRVLATYVGDQHDGAAVVNLTGRESAVLSLLAAGHTASGIAHRLTISPRTVNKHLEHVYRKLGVSDRLGAVRAAAALDLLRGPDPTGGAVR